jgi:hypothetical protein
MLSQEMYEQVAELTGQREISMSDYIRVALQDKLAGEQQSANGRVKP